MLIQPLVTVTAFITIFVTFVLPYDCWQGSHLRIQQEGWHPPSIHAQPP